MIKGGGRGKPQSLVEPKLPWGGGEEVPSPHHLGDPHGGVVHHHGQLIGPGSVPPADGKVTALGGHILAVCSLQAIGKRDGPVGHPHLPVGRALGAFFRNLLRRQMDAGAGGGYLMAMGGLGQPLLPGAEAGIEKPPGL